MGSEPRLDLRSIKDLIYSNITRRSPARLTLNHLLSNSCVGVCTLQKAAAGVWQSGVSSQILRWRVPNPNSSLTSESTSEPTPGVLRHRKSGSLAESCSPPASANIPPSSSSSAARQLGSAEERRIYITQSPTMCCLYEKLQPISNMTPHHHVSQRCRSL